MSIHQEEEGFITEEQNMVVTAILAEIAKLHAPSDVTAARKILVQELMELNKDTYFKGL